VYWTVLVIVDSNTKEKNKLKLSHRDLNTWWWCFLRTTCTATSRSPLFHSWKLCAPSIDCLEVTFRPSQQSVCMSVKTWLQTQWTQNNSELELRHSKREREDGKGKGDEDDKESVWAFIAQLKTFFPLSMSTQTVALWSVTFTRHCILRTKELLKH
jgi:hypothetical protein